MTTIKVRPFRRVLDDSGYVWESFLWKAGFNGLPERDKVGIISKAFKFTEYGHTYICFNVFWKALGIETENIFPGEVEVIEMD